MKIFVYASESGTYALTKGCQIRVENKHENLCFILFFWYNICLILVEPLLVRTH